MFGILMAAAVAIVLAIWQLSNGQPVEFTPALQAIAGAIVFVASYRVIKGTVKH